MESDNLRETENVDDRRGESYGGSGMPGGFSFGPRMAFGGGGFGFVILLILWLVFGVNPLQLLSGGYAPDNSPVPNSQSGLAEPRADDAAYVFSRRIVGSAEDIWTPILQNQGIRFTPTTLTVYDNATPTGCGVGQSSAGPFYCPSDSHIYLDLAFFNELRDRFGAPGDFARAYVIAHEFGHHIQNLLGIMDKYKSSATGADSNSVRIELQADCFAGIWANRANARFHILENGDVEGGLKAASAVGDDTLEKENQGFVVPDSFTHGTSDQRMRWFQRGLQAGDIAACDTFGARQL
jgi:predicted metalloprotease